MKFWSKTHDPLLKRQPFEFSIMKGLSFESQILLTHKMLVGTILEKQYFFV